MKTTPILKNLAIAVFLSFASLAYSAESPIKNLTITARGGQFSPAKIEAAASDRLKVIVQNNENYEIEFESISLNKEEKIQPGKSKEIFFRDLKPGKYTFFDDNNDKAQGELTIK